MKTIKCFALIQALLLVFTYSISSQTLELKEQPVLYSHSPNGDVNNPMLSPVPPVEKQISIEEQQLERQLDAARTSNNISLTRQIQAQLDKIRGDTPVLQECDPRVHSKLNLNIPVPETDYNVSQAHNLDVWSNAIATTPVGAPNAGRVWLTTTHWSSAGPDTIKVYYSNNNGASWLYYGYFWLGFNYSYTADELDIEVVYDGTEVWLFGVAGMDDFTTGRRACQLFRLKTSTGGLYTTILNFPGNGTSTNYYNPRITSDNANFTASAYIMILCSMDSLHNGTIHDAKQKYVKSQTPFDAGGPVLNYVQPNGSTGFYWQCTGCSTGLRLYGDIAYYQDPSGGVNRVVAVYGNSYGGFNSIYVSYLDGYSNLGGNFLIPQTNFNTNVRVAYNGGGQNRYGIITYLLQVSATDWNPYVVIGAGGVTGTWTGGSIDNSSAVARTIDIAAVRGVNGYFKICYGQDNGSTSSAYYMNYNNSTTSPLLISNLPTDVSFAKPRAGYVNGGGDDCLAIWGGAATGAYASRLCNTTLGIQQTTVPISYSLSQNYPNPFNPTTNISYGLPIAGIVKITVYNLLGEAITELVNEYKQVGSYEINFDASNLASGVYLYKLETNNYSDIKKMALIK